MFMYGMRLRPFSIGCQPMSGLIRVEEDNTGRYWNILIYANPLNDHEQDGYELDYLGERTADMNSLREYKCWGGKVDENNPIYVWAKCLDDAVQLARIRNKDLLGFQWTGREERRLNEE